MRRAAAQALTPFPPPPAGGDSAGLVLGLDSLGAGPGLVLDLACQRLWLLD